MKRPYTCPIVPFPDAKSIDLPGNPVYSVSCEGMWELAGLTPGPLSIFDGEGERKGDCSIRFEDIAKLGNLHLTPGQDVPEVIGV